jgi:hypothetical protein
MSMFVLKTEKYGLSFSLVENWKCAHFMTRAAAKRIHKIISTTIGDLLAEFNFSDCETKLTMITHLSQKKFFFSNTTIILS